MGRTVPLLTKLVCFINTQCRDRDIDVPRFAAVADMNVKVLVRIDAADPPDARWPHGPGHGQVLVAAIAPSRRQHLGVHEIQSNLTDFRTVEDDPEVTRSGHHVHPWIMRTDEVDKSLGALVTAAEHSGCYLLAYAFPGPPDTRLAPIGLLLGLPDVFSQVRRHSQWYRVPCESFNK